MFDSRGHPPSAFVIQWRTAEFFHFHFFHFFSFFFFSILETVETSADCSERGQKKKNVSLVKRTLITSSNDTSQTRQIYYKNESVIFWKPDFFLLTCRNLHRAVWTAEIHSCGNRTPRHWRKGIAVTKAQDGGKTFI